MGVVWLTHLNLGFDLDEVPLFLIIIYRVGYCCGGSCGRGGFVGLKVGGFDTVGTG